MKDIITVEVLDDYIKFPKRIFDNPDRAYKFAHNISKLWGCDVRICCYVDDKCWGKLTIHVNRKVGEECLAIK